MCGDDGIGKVQDFWFPDDPSDPMVFSFLTPSRLETGTESCVIWSSRFPEKKDIIFFEYTFAPTGR